MAQETVRLADAVDPRRYGGKAAQLAVAEREGLAVPTGIALSWTLVDAIAAGDPAAVAALTSAAASLVGPSAVRSSDAAEDSVQASFAGQHVSVLNVPAPGLADAVTAVWRSARGEPALAYRRSATVGGTPRIGAVIQQMVPADVAGVAFWPNPATGADEIVIEAAWGLGEAVASGLVVPDHVRLSPQGAVLERRPGMKDLEVRPRAGGGTDQRPVTGQRAASLCLGPGELAQLLGLTKECQRVFGGSQDLEWALAGGRLWLLQRRPVTTGEPAQDC